MIGTTKKTRRLASWLAVAAVAVAVAAPAGLAGGKPDYGPPDPWAIPYLNAAATPLPAGFVTDTVSSARAAHNQAVLSTALPHGFVTDTVLSARGQQLQLTTTVSRGFDWGSFGIGIGAGIGALVILGALATRFARLRQLVSA
jgi:hypothetical protein